MTIPVIVSRQVHHVELGEGEHVTISYEIDATVAGRTIRVGAQDEAQTYSEAERGAWYWAIEAFYEHAVSSDPADIEWQVLGDIDEPARRARDIAIAWREQVLEHREMAA